MKTKHLIKVLILSSVVITACKHEQTVTPERKNLVDAVFASGNVLMQNQYIITSLTEGYLQESLVEEGDTVAAGQLLFQIYDDASQAQLESAKSVWQTALENNQPGSPVLGKLNQQLQKVKNQCETDSVNFNRYKNLVLTNAVSKADFDRAKLAFENSKAERISLENSIRETKENLAVELANAKAGLVTQQNNTSYYSLTSNTRGIVLQKYIENGETVKRGEAVAEIGSGDFIARLLISEEDISKIRLEQEVFIELNSHKNKSFRGKISKIYPAFSTQEQSFVAEAIFTENVPGIKAGTQLQANIVVEKKQQALVIPATYLLADDYVLKGDKNNKVRVKTGISTSEWVEITEGLNETDKLYQPRKK